MACLISSILAVISRNMSSWVTLFIPGRFQGPSGRALFSDEEGFTFSEAPFEDTLHEGLKGASPSEGFKGASLSEGGLEGGLKGASRGLQGGFEGASRGLEGGLKPSEGEGGFERLEGGFKGA